MTESAVARPSIKGAFVESLVEGSEVEGVFLVKRRSLRRTREGRPFLGLVFYDRSGTIDGQVWDDAEAFRVPFAEGDFLRLRGFVDRFRDRLHLQVLTCTTCQWEELAPDDFLPASERPPSEMRAELRGRVRGIANPYLRALLERFEADSTLMNAILLSPAATTVHHDRVGGLLEHTLSLMALADLAARHYRDVDRDLLVAGAFVHDLGKVRELRREPGFPYTDEGQLLGHIVLGYELAMRKIDELPGFPGELRTALGHLILSHQGEYEWGSPKRPKTLEAIVLHYLDNLDSKVDVYRKAVAASEAAGRGAWTDYVRTLGRALYRRTSGAASEERRGKPRAESSGVRENGERWNPAGRDRPAGETADDLFG